MNAHAMNAHLHRWPRSILVASMILMLAVVLESCARRATSPPVFGCDATVEIRPDGTVRVMQKLLLDRRMVAMFGYEEAPGFPERFCKGWHWLGLVPDAAVTAANPRPEGLEVVCSGTLPNLEALVANATEVCGYLVPELELSCDAKGRLVFRVPSRIGVSAAAGIDRQGSGLGEQGKMSLRLRLIFPGTVESTGFPQVDERTLADALEIRDGASAASFWDRLGRGWEAVAEANGLKLPEAPLRSRELKEKAIVAEERRRMTVMPELAAGPADPGWTFDVVGCESIRIIPVPGEPRSALAATLKDRQGRFSRTETSIMVRLKPPAGRFVAEWPQSILVRDVELFDATGQRIRVLEATIVDTGDLKDPACRVKLVGAGTRGPRFSRVAATIEVLTCAGYDSIDVVTTQDASLERICPGAVLKGWRVEAGRNNLTCRGVLQGPRSIETLVLMLSPTWPPLLTPVKCDAIAGKFSREVSLSRTETVDSVTFTRPRELRRERVGLTLTDVRLP